MGKVLVIYEKRMPERYHILMDIVKEYFEQSGLSVEKFDMGDGTAQDSCQEKLADAALEYICTLDMAGFQTGTILGGPRYNIMRAKQIHIVINEKSFLPYQDTELALNLYLFMPDTVRRSLLREQYIPNLAFYKPFDFKRDSGRDREELLRILETVRKDCADI